MRIHKHFILKHVHVHVDIYKYMYAFHKYTMLFLGSTCIPIVTHMQQWPPHTIYFVYVNAAMCVWVNGLYSYWLLV